MKLNIMKLNTEHLLKYVIMFLVITISTFLIPTCGVLRKHAIYVGLIGSSAFVVLDMCFPNYYEKPRHLE